MPDDDVDDDRADNLATGDVLVYINEKIAEIDGNGIGAAPESTMMNELEDVLFSTKIPKGPTDVTSFHDFYKLDIAFENVWEEIFDPLLVRLGQRLYGQIVREKNTRPQIDQIETLQDLKDILQEAKDLLKQRVLMTTVPNIVKTFLADIGPSTWSNLSLDDQIDVIYWANEYAKYSDLYEDAIDQAYYRGYMDRTLDYARLIIDVSLSDNGAPPLPTVIEELAEALTNKEQHSFNVYVKNSINFGVLLNYRQEWEPQTYQVGELVNTIPLAPKETRKYSKKQTFKESRKRKEINNALSVHRGETAQSNRAESEILRRANEQDSFSATASAGGTIGVVKVNGSSNLSTNSANESKRTKKNFRKAVTKSAQEFKKEQKLEVEFSSEALYEETITGEISNPNEEIVVTYLFYELQRRFKVQEYLRDVTPVILVANDVPNPDEIDEDWLLRHEWILRRVILDDDFLKAFDLLNQARSGKDIEIDTLRANVQHQTRAFKDTKIELETYVKSRGTTERELRRAVNAHANALENSGDSFGESIIKAAVPGVFGGIKSIFGGDDDEDKNKAEAYKAKQDTVEEALARNDQAITESRTRLTGVSTALDQATDKYTAAVRARVDRELALIKLRVHVKDNILYYMQAIWDHEPPDQRFFRLCDVIVPTFGDLDYSITPDRSAGWNVRMPPAVNMNPKRGTTLKEVADLDNLLGYKGNYMIFPMIVDHHPITDFMAADYFDLDKILDPDESVTTMLQGKSGERIWGGIKNKLLEDERAAVEPEVSILRERIQEENITERERAELQKEIDGIYRRLEINIDAKLNALKEELFADALTDEIVVPSDMLFIAALPDNHPVLEDFKLKHREMDVLKVAAELQEQQVDIVRRKARLLSNKLDDPESARRVLIQGGNPSVEVDAG